MSREPQDPVTLFQKAFAEAARSHHLECEPITRIAEDEIRVWTRSAIGQTRHTVCLSSGIHGDEPCGPMALLRFLEVASLSKDCDWVIAPLLNPTGYRVGTRENAEGIDLNRDFYRRRSAEVTALIDWWNTRSPKSLIHLSLHEDWEADGFYLYEILTSTNSPVGEELMDKFRQHFPVEEEGLVDGHELSAPGLIFHRPEPDEDEGWPEAIWLVKRFPTHSLTFEAPGRQNAELRTEGLVSAITSALQRLDLTVK